MWLIAGYESGGQGLFCCIPADGLTFDLVVAFQRGLSCSSTVIPLVHTASTLERRCMLS